MTPYRKLAREKPRATDVETAAIVELVLRMKRLRRRAALPVVLLSGGAAWLGGTAHALGYWTLLEARADGWYYVTAASLVVSAVLAALPIALPGAVLYLVLRGRLRKAWRDEARRQEVEGAWPDRDEWLERTPLRFP
jgi:zinc transporter ZupT